MKRAIVLLLLLAGCNKSAEQPKPDKRPPSKLRVTVIVAVPRVIEYAVEAVGTIEASEEIAVPAGVSGIIDAVRFKEGDEVTPETILVEIEVQRFALGEERAKAEHDRATAQAVLAETVHGNRLKLAEEGRKQNKDYVTTEQLAVLRADLDKAKAEAQRARADLELARRDHRNARVRPPIRGLINGKLVSRGEYVKAETVVARILNVSVLHVRFSVPELEASRLSRGQELRFGIRSAPGRDFKAKLFHLNQKADPLTRSVECKAEVIDRIDALRAGTFAQVRVTTGKQDGLLVPERAVLPTDRGFVIFVLNGAKARERIVRLGLRLDDHVEIAEGLAAGDRVVVDGALTLRDGMEVEEVPPSAPAKEGPGS